MKIVFNHIEDIVSIHNFGLYNKMYNLGCTSYISDMVLSENHILIRKHLVDENMLSVFTLSSNEIFAISKLFKTYSTNISFKDLAICYYAKQNKATVVSNESSVIKIAETLEVKHTSTIALINSLLIKKMEYVVK